VIEYGLDWIDWWACIWKYYFNSLFIYGIYKLNCFFFILLMRKYMNNIYDFYRILIRGFFLVVDSWIMVGWVIE
jgi:hypothetical protein